MDIDEISVHKLSCIELISPNCVNHCRLLAHQQVQRITILCSTFHRCLYRLQLSSYYKPRHCMSLTSQTSYHKGQETLSCVPWVNVWHVSKDKVNGVSVRTLCGKTQHILISSIVLQVAVSSFARNHCTACQLPFTTGIISGERFSAHLDSMLGT